jgi:hypothetical protein
MTMAKALKASVTLELSIPEAQVLLYILENIGGRAHEDGARPLATGVWQALVDAGLRAPEDTDELPISRGEIEFVPGSLGAFQYL